MSVVGRMQNGGYLPSRVPNRPVRCRPRSRLSAKRLQFGRSLSRLSISKRAIHSRAQ